MISAYLTGSTTESRMKTVLNIIAPNTRMDMIRKMLIFVAIVVAWNLFWVRFLRGRTDLSIFDSVIDAIGVGGPFVVLFYLGSWQQIALLRRMTTRAKVDPLSQLLNRQTFFGRVKKALPTKKTGLILLIDADFFKRVNDEHGHAVGDQCIAAIGHRLNWHLRGDALAGRIGGEEFGVFLPSVNEQQGRSIATRIGQPVTFSDVTNQQHLVVTLSIGAAWIDPEKSVEQHFTEADSALYRAKSIGRACIVFANEEAPIFLRRPVGSPRLVANHAETN